MAIPRQLLAWGILMGTMLIPSVLHADGHGNGERAISRDTIAVVVFFRVGESKIDQGYMDNDSRLESFINSLKETSQGGSERICGIHIIGYASPEGTPELNKTLSRKRTENLYRYILSMVDLPDSLFTKESPGINWDGLDRALALSSHPYAPQVQHIIRDEPIYTYDKKGALTRSRKQVLMNLNKGRTWLWMIDNIFPELRCSSASVEYIIESERENKEEDENVPTGIIEPGEVKSGDELPRQAATYSDGDTAEAKSLNYPALALRSNLLYDVFYMPNYGWAPMPDVQLEYFLPGKKFSLLGEFTFPYWEKPSQHKYFKIHNLHLEGRFYFRSLPWACEEDYAKSYSGWYMGIYAEGSKYTIGLNSKKGWKGEGWGAGLKGGYVLNLSSNGRWKLDFSLGLGVYRTKYDPFVYGNPATSIDDNKYYYDYTGDPDAFKKRNHKRTWIGPTNIGVTISYTILYKRKAASALGFSRKEAVR